MNCQLEVKKKLAQFWLDLNLGNTAEFYPKTAVYQLSGKMLSTDNHHPEPAGLTTRAWSICRRIKRTKFCVAEYPIKFCCNEGRDELSFIYKWLKFEYNSYKVYKGIAPGSLEYFEE